MPRPPLSPGAADLLARPCHATISCVKPSGQPVSVPTWYLYEDGHVLVNMDAGRKRLAWLRHEPRVALSAIDPEDWFTHVSLQGHVTEFIDDPDLTDIDRLAQHYNGQPYPNRTRPRVTALIEIDRWHGWGRLKQS